MKYWKFSQNKAFSIKARLISFTFILFLILPFLAIAATSAGKNINRVNIGGNKKIETDAILAKIQSKKGDKYSARVVREDVLALFQTDYFSNIEVYTSNEDKNSLDLEFKVTEKPSVVEIIFEGNNELKSEDLLETAAIKNYEILNMNKVNQTVEKIQKLYEEKGYFLAKVEARVEDEVKGQTVRVIFKVDENDKVKVKKITFLGNQKINDSEIKSKMMTSEGGYFSALSGSGQYKQEIFDRDIQIIRFLYYNKGYVQAKVDRPQVYVTPDRKSIYLTIRIEEGEQYHIGEVDFDGNLLFPRDELFSLIKIHKNDVFAYDVLQNDLSNLTAKYGDLGYAYTNVIPRTRFDEKEKKVDLVFDIDKGNKVYFGKINVIGNTKTRDKVVRRELQIAEGELYHETKRRKSIEAVQRLGFFEEVNFKTSVSPESQDIMDIDIMVKERNTGQIQLSAGYSSATDFSMTGSLNQTNFRGLGQNIGVSINFSKTASYYNLSFTEPYYNDSTWTLGTDLYQSVNTARRDYDEEHVGGALRLGHPLFENTKFFLRYKLDNTKLENKYTTLNSQKVLITDPDLFPLSTASGVASSVTSTLEYDTRNDRFSPSSGILLSGSVEYSGLGGDIKYIKSTGTYRFFSNIFWDVVFRNSIQYGIISGLDGKAPPFNELFLLGGAYSLRGYRSYTVGKTVLSNKKKTELMASPFNYSAEKAERYAMTPFGGNQQLMYQGEFQFPMIKEAGIYGVGFFDMGSADDEIKDTLFYSDIGFGIRWFSPIGPLRFEWGFPLNPDPIQHPEPTVFEFSIGTPF